MATINYPQVINHFVTKATDRQRFWSAFRALLWPQIRADSQNFCHMTLTLLLILMLMLVLCLINN